MNLDGSGRIWMDFNGFGRIWTDLDGSERIWTDLDGFGNISANAYQKYIHKYGCAITIYAMPLIRKDNLLR